MKGRSKVILGSLKAVRSGPASREDRSLSEDRPGERGLAVWTVGVVIWPR